MTPTASDLPDAARLRIEALHRADEAATVRDLLGETEFTSDQKARIDKLARRLVTGVRENRRRAGGVDVFLNEYGLSSEEGITLMCLAESLLRVPDAATADKLIRDKIGGADWRSHLGQSKSLLVNASTWALMLTGRVISIGDATAGDLEDFLRRLVASSGEAVIRQAMIHAMRIMGGQFILGRTMAEALDRARGEATGNTRYSFDMLGEAARTEPDAQRYLAAYQDAILTLGREVQGRDVIAAPGISVKLSALHPRYEYGQRERVLAELAPRLADLMRAARDAGINLCIDAEEADRLEISLDVIDAVLSMNGLKDWDGFGVAVQAYQKRATAVVDWLAERAAAGRWRLMVRLVKGAYWDSEIKLSQEGGYCSYPVFTRKESTDVCYLACARRLLARPRAFYPQFATHNAHTVAAVLELAGTNRAFEFQRLHGMGEALYEQVIADDREPLPCRVYAPVGGPEDLLAYLVRRLLENGSNSSFVNRLADDAAPIAGIVADPADKVRGRATIPHPRIPLPRDLYLPARRNAAGLDLADPAALRALLPAIAGAGPWSAAPMVGGDKGEQSAGADSRAVTNPADRGITVGDVVQATAADVETALALATAAAADWDRTPAEERAAILERAAALFEDAMPELMALNVKEAGKTLADAVAEVREAVDFCRYYAERARADFAGPQDLPGPTGGRNQIALHGRGVFACISPWNFPLAIFTGQVAAALAAGNAVVAKPAEQTPLIAARAAQLLRQAGVPEDVFHLLPGGGPEIGGLLTRDPRIAGVVFTGSVETAQTINRALAARDGAIGAFIAETGGQNAMIVDSTALPEQVVDDAVASAFQSAGQRCSALRVLFLQDDVAGPIIEMLLGRMAELALGDPALLATDVGPVIDSDAQAALSSHARRMESEATLLYKVELAADRARGTFFAPRAFEIDRLGLLRQEIFGPILHVVRYQAAHLDRVIDAVRDTGYGLTLGIHSRVDATVAYIHDRLKVGNTYVNRNMIGATVGVQPFGGEGLSGTGPKAGGPRYLHRFAAERTLAVDITAAGGDPKLLALTEDETDA